LTPLLVLKITQLRNKRSFYVEEELEDKFIAGLICS